MRRTPEGQLHFDVYRKPTHTGRYLQYTSNHPENVKKGVAMSLFNRVSYVTETNTKPKEEEKVKAELRKNGYPEKTIKRARNAVEKRKLKKPPKTQEIEKKRTVVILYVEGVCHDVRRVLAPLGIRTVMQSSRT